jgi:hemolysin-activating ACP:hemolysin acyltransferase
VTDSSLSRPAAPRPAFRTFRPDKPATALGLAVSFLMTRPAFANLKFGEWSRILVGQINRNHYAFVLDDKGRVAGFAGWALTTRELAELWVEGKRDISYEESLKGECMLFNAWCASSFRAHRFMVDEARKIIVGKETLYFKRHYPDGHTRPVRLNVNEFVAGHIDRKLLG